MTTHYSMRSEKMNSEDFEVLSQCTQWIAEGRRALLATVVKTWGSSPRPEGAMLCIRDDGRIVGSVSGGCIEDDLIHLVRQTGARLARPEVLEYGVMADQARRFGLPCGGTIKLVLEPVSEASCLHEIVDAIGRGKIVARTLDLCTGRASIQATSAVAGVKFTEDALTAVYGPRYRLLVIGSGQLSRYFCEIALGLDYQVTVCDPREEYADMWQVSGTSFSREMPDDLVTRMHLDKRSAVVALSHDPKLDDLALMEALRTPAFYIGALGSRKNNAARRRRLLEFDLTEKDIARLHGPAGIYIGSKTPPEIAVSILAEITAVKNDVNLVRPLQVEHAKNHLGLEQTFFASSCSS